MNKNKKIIEGPNDWIIVLNEYFEKKKTYFFNKREAIDALQKDWPEGYEIITQEMVKKSRFYNGGKV